MVLKPELYEATSLSSSSMGGESDFQCPESVKAEAHFSSSTFVISVYRRLVTCCNARGAYMQWPETDAATVQVLSQRRASTGVAAPDFPLPCSYAWGGKAT